MGEDVEILTKIIILKNTIENSSLYIISLIKLFQKIHEDSLANIGNVYF